VLRAGIPPETAWEMSVPEVMAVLEARTRNSEERAREGRVAAWFAGLYSRIDRLPPLGEVAGVKTVTPQKQSIAEMRAVLREVVAIRKTSEEMTARL
jgi:hypothetical protein